MPKMLYPRASLFRKNLEVLSQASWIRVARRKVRRSIRWQWPYAVRGTVMILMFLTRVAIRIWCMVETAYCKPHFPSLRLVCPCYSSRHFTSPRFIIPRFLTSPRFTSPRFTSLRSINPHFTSPRFIIACFTSPPFYNSSFYTESLVLPKPRFATPRSVYNPSFYKSQFY